MKKLSIAFILAGVLAVGLLLFYPIDSPFVGHSRTDKTIIHLNGFAKMISNNPWFVKRVHEIIPNHQNDYRLSSKKFYDFAKSLPNNNGIELVFDPVSEGKQDYIDFWGRPYKLKYINSERVSYIYIWSIRARWN